MARLWNHGRSDREMHSKQMAADPGESTTTIAGRGAHLPETPELARGILGAHQELRAAM